MQRSNICEVRVSFRLRAIVAYARGVDGRLNNFASYFSFLLLTNFVAYLVVVVNQRIKNKSTSGLRCHRFFERIIAILIVCVIFE